MKTVLIDKSDLFERKIEEVIEYRYRGLTRWAVVKYEDSTNKYDIPLWALGIRNVPLFGVVND